MLVKLFYWFLVHGPF